MAKPDPTSLACEHLITDDPVPFPFDVEMVLDGVSGFTDAIVRCRSCGQAYLIEMLDWWGARFQRRTFRTSLLGNDVVAQYAHNRQRSSCDLKRASAEWYAVQTESKLTPLRITLDLETSQQIESRVLPADADIPMGHWRERLN
jgi:hypothetical protein